MSKRIASLRVEFPNGDVFLVPAKVIAEHRAKHYADGDPDTTYEAEFEYTMTDEYQLRDWAGNNMDWDDVKARAVLQPKPPLPKNYYTGEWGGNLRHVYEGEKS
jgi:hypothetical protein